MMRLNNTSTFKYEFCKLGINNRKNHESTTKRKQRGDDKR